MSIENGTFTSPNTTIVGEKITLGFKPKILILYSLSTNVICMYDETYRTDKYIRITSSKEELSIPNTSSGNILINSIEDDGFTYSSGINSKGVTVSYTAVK